MDHDKGWTCPLCGFRNPKAAPGSTSRMLKCQICGVSRDASKGAYSLPSSTSTTPPLSSSLPSPASLFAPPPLHFTVPTPSPRTDEKGTNCPVCTFLNHPSLVTCEICESPLPLRTATRPTKPVESAGGNEETNKVKKKGVVRLSFRKAGDKEFYKLLKRGLEGRGWDRGLVRFSFFFQ